MHSFEEYTLLVYETPLEHYSEFPTRRFIAHLDEIPKASIYSVFGDVGERLTASQVANYCVN